MNQLAGKPDRLTTHPRHRADLPEVGVFCARGAERPNPIGLAVVELLKRDKHTNAAIPFAVRTFVSADGLMSYGYVIADGHRLVGTM
jgi:hypothetical protein